MNEKTALRIIEEARAAGVACWLRWFDDACEVWIAEGNAKYTVIASVEDWHNYRKA